MQGVEMYVISLRRRNRCGHRSIDILTSAIVFEVRATVSDVEAAVVAVARLHVVIVVLVLVSVVAGLVHDAVVVLVVAALPRRLARSHRREAGGQRGGEQEETQEQARRVHSVRRRDVLKGPNNQTLPFIHLTRTLDVVELAR